MNGEFWRDAQMDKIIETIIEIFSKIDGIELIRLTGLTRYLNKISGKHISTNEIEIIIDKLKNAGIIKYDYIFICPHCKEKSYIIKFTNENNVKLCDTCQTLYNLIYGQTLFKI